MMNNESNCSFYEYIDKLYTKPFMTKNIRTTIGHRIDNIQEEIIDEYDLPLDHLRTDMFPKHAIHIVLTVPGIKETEIFAPNYAHGKRVALIHYPYTGGFKIPALTVNNNNETADKVFSIFSQNAVGISAKTASICGINYGDTVLVIPINEKDNSITFS